jgi:hypothetical protein
MSGPPELFNFKLHGLADHSVARLVLCSSSVNILAVCHTDHQHEQNIILDLIDNTIIADSNPIGPVCTRQLLNSVGPWIVRKVFEPSVNRRDLRFVDSAEILLC